MEQETIAAIATPFGSGGIGIIRISGTQATVIAGQLFQQPPSGYKGSEYEHLDSFTSHKLTHGYIVDGEHIIDEVMLVVMRSPHSYTREDVVEIQSHSGAVILNRILKLVIEKGARLAQPGEFTKRAYLNGRIDLSQAEAVADIISAKSEASLKINTNQLVGRLKKEIDGLNDQLMQILAQLQAQLEFSDDVDDELDSQLLASTIDKALLEPIKRLLSQYSDGHIFREGVRMGIVGRPNVGKSSLLNYLLRKEKAIVTHIPGTTRDLIEDCFSINGIPIIVTDTAGLHNTENPVEQIGIQKTQENISQSDLVLFVVDGSLPFSDEDYEVYLQTKAKKVIMVVNKMDLFHGGESITIPEQYGSLPVVKLSALTGEGVEALKKEVFDLCTGGVEIPPGRSIIPNLRQKMALDMAHQALNKACDGLKNGVSEEFVIDDLERAQTSLNQIIGQDIEVDILDEIFSRFCIGK